MKKIIMLICFVLMQVFAYTTVTTKYEARINDFFNRYYYGLKYLAELDVNLQDKDNVQNIALNLFVDNNEFLDEDVDFITSAIFTQIGLNQERGDIVSIRRVFFSGDPKLEGKAAVMSRPRAIIRQTNNQKWYVVIAVVACLFLISFVMVMLFFVFYLINMNKKIEMLMLENMELAKKNILVDRNIDINNESSKFSEANPEPEVEKMEADVDEFVMVNSKEKEDNSIMNILKKIDGLDKAKATKTKKKAPVQNSKQNDLKDKLNKPLDIQIQFQELIKMPNKLLFKVLQGYDVKVLSAALLGADDALLEKVMRNMIYKKQQDLRYEMERLKNLNALSADSVLKMQSIITDDINKMISAGQIEWA